MSKKKDNEGVLDKDKVKIAVETYLNMFPYSTNTQIADFLNKSSLNFKSEYSRQQIGAVCRDSPKISFMLKGSVKYYYVDDIMVDIEDKYRLDFLEIRTQLLEEYMQRYLQAVDEGFIPFEEFASKNERYNLLKVSLGYDKDE